MLAWGSVLCLYLAASYLTKVVQNFLYRIQLERDLTLQQLHLDEESRVSLAGRLLNPFFRKEKKKNCYLPHTVAKFHWSPEMNRYGDEKSFSTQSRNRCMLIPLHLLNAS